MDPLPPLPEGWIEKHDSITGKSFYYNTETQDSVWARPLQKVEESSPLPEGWIIKQKSSHDFASRWGKTYNTITGESKWTLPGESAAAGTSVDPPQDNKSSAQPANELNDEPASD
jgi:hypothetical protein